MPEFRHGPNTSETMRDARRANRERMATNPPRLDPQAPARGAPHRPARPLRRRNHVSLTFFRSANETKNNASKYTDESYQTVSRGIQETRRGNVTQFLQTRRLNRARTRLHRR